MHSHIFIPLIGLLAFPFLSAQSTSKDANNKKPCVVPEVAFLGFDHVINLTASAQHEHAVDGKPLRLLRTPPSVEETPILGPAGDLMDFGFRDGHLSIIGGRLAYDLPTIKIFPPVLVPWKFDFVDNPRTFTASYACDKHGKQILVLRPDGAEGSICSAAGDVHTLTGRTGFAVENTKDATQQVFIKPSGYVGDAIDVQLIVMEHIY